MDRVFLPIRQQLRHFVYFLLATTLLGVALAPPAGAASRPPLRAANGMVVAPEPHAARIGAEVLKAGGNAVDATVAVAFALTATYPLAAPVGGGGFMLVRHPDGRHTALDFREVAPTRLTADLFLDENGEPIPGASLDGGKAVGVPGTVAGLGEAHARWGTRKWKDLVQPSVRLARRGFVVDPFLSRVLVANATKVAAHDATRAIFMRDGAPLVAGDTLVQAELSATLKLVARHGPAGLYSGQVGQAIVDAVEAAGGVMRLDDLAAYRPVERIPIERTYRGYRVISFPPPSSGGVALLQILSLLDPFDFSTYGPGSSFAVHLLTETERLAYADRSKWLGDPGFGEIPVDALLDEDYLRERGQLLRTNHATRSTRIQPGEPIEVPHGETLHFSVADRHGGAVSVTLTLNSALGTGIVAPGTGVLLNNQIDDFAVAPGLPNQYGLIGGAANAIEPGKRPLSSMTPTIVEHAQPSPRPFLVLGSPGGATIITSVAQVLINVIDHGMPLQEAVDAPRVHHQWLPDRLYYEPRALAHDTISRLHSMGHALEQRQKMLGNVNAIGVDPETGDWLGAPDPRRASAAAGH
ncbi:MAG: gamma-glutamyltransferase [bacterium]|nr:gamma-glutamyltransferase [bacterium]